MLQSPPSTSGARPPARSRSMRSARRRACSMMATWLRSEPGVASSAYLPGSTTPRSSAPSSARRRCRPASRSASGAFAQPGTLVGAGGRRPRLDGADSRPIFMPENYQIKIHGIGPNMPTGPGRRGKGGPVLLLPHGGGPACCCFFLRRGPGTGQFLAADPDGGQCDEQGEQRDSRRDQEPSGESGGQACTVSWAGDAAGWRPAVMAAVAFLRLSAAVVQAIVPSAASPIAPPTCWPVLSRLAATPACCSATLCRATRASGTNSRPSPEEVTSIGPSSWPG